MKKLLIASTSTVHGSGYLEYLTDELIEFFTGIKEIVFIPYARPSGMTHEAYTNAARAKFEALNIKVKGLHESVDPKEELRNAEAVFTGGGNTFLLLKTLYEFDLIKELRSRIENGMPYMGTSAGSNITGLTIGTTNDMPIVYPPSFDAIGVLPFNLNPHYLDPDPSSTHKGETRQTRIEEFLMFNDIKVVGLREGSWLRVKGDEIELKGPLTARIFVKGKEVYEYKPGAFSITN
jgi:dipeptidase E